MLLAQETSAQTVEAAGWFLEHAWLIALIPGVAFPVIILFGKRMPFKGAEVGIASMGYLMDTITDQYLASGTTPDEADYAAELELLHPLCPWTHGYWQFADDSLRRWNELQNTPKDIQLLTSHLLAEYRHLSADNPNIRRAQR